MGLRRAFGFIPLDIGGAGLSGTNQPFREYRFSTTSIESKTKLMPIWASVRVLGDRFSRLTVCLTVEEPIPLGLARALTLIKFVKSTYDHGRRKARPDSAAKQVSGINEKRDRVITDEKR